MDYIFPTIPSRIKQPVASLHQYETLSDPKPLGTYEKLNLKRDQISDKAKINASVRKIKINRKMLTIITIVSSICFVLIIGFIILALALTSRLILLA